MANTGTVIVTTLGQYYTDDNTATGATKNNIKGQADYIAPYVNTTTCPITYNTACPSEVIITWHSGSTEIEFSIPNSVLDNPALAKLRLVVKSDSTEVASQLILFSAIPANFVSVTLTGLPSSTLVLSMEYQNSDGIVQSTCESMATFGTPAL